MINWKTAKEFEDITYKKCDGVARIAFNRPDVRNAFRPNTTTELIEAFYDAQEDTSIWRGTAFVLKVRHLKMVFGVFAVVVIKKLEVIKVMWVKMGIIG